MKKKTSPNDSYAVGYCKPPKDTQFKPGQSGNPSGRPKGSKSFQTLIEEELNETMPFIEKGKRVEITIKRALVKRALHHALAKADYGPLKTLNSFKDPHDVLFQEFDEIEVRLVLEEPQQTLANGQLIQDHRAERLRNSPDVDDTH